MFGLIPLFLLAIEKPKVWILHQNLCHVILKLSGTLTLDLFVAINTTQILRSRYFRHESLQSVKHLRETYNYFLVPGEKALYCRPKYNILSIVSAFMNVNRKIH